MKEIIEDICKLCEEISKKNNGGKSNMLYAFGMFYGIMKHIPENCPRKYLEEQLEKWSKYNLDNK
jgi:hypothetical protein